MLASEASSPATTLWMSNFFIAEFGFDGAYCVTGTERSSLISAGTLPDMPFIEPISKSTRLTMKLLTKVLFSNVNGIVNSFWIPCMSRVPVTSYPLSVLAKAEEVKRMVGYFSASNHFALLACLFFMPLPVLIEATSMATSNIEASRLSSSKVMSPSILVNTPDGSLLVKATEYPSAIFQVVEEEMVKAEKRMMAETIPSKLEIFMRWVFCLMMGQRSSSANAQTLS